MITSQLKHANSDITPDLTPLLDIIFIVMVFLLLTANINIKTMSLDIPSTDQVEVLDSPDNQVITVNLLAKAPNWAIEQTSYDDWTAFSDALLEIKQRYPKRSLVIGSDKSVSVENMLKLLAFMQQNHINATNIIMDEEK